MTYAIGIDIDDNKCRFDIDYGNNLYCSRKKLISLTVYDEENKLDFLYIMNNELESLKIIGGKCMRLICCFNNNLKELDLSKYEKLSTITCDFELEENIKLPHNKKIYIYYE